MQTLKMVKTVHFILVGIVIGIGGARLAPKALADTIFTESARPRSIIFSNSN